MLKFVGAQELRPGMVIQEVFDDQRYRVVSVDRSDPIITKVTCEDRHGFSVVFDFWPATVFVAGDKIEDFEELRSKEE